MSVIRIEVPSFSPPLTPEAAAVERARLDALLADLPSGTIQISGYWCPSLTCPCEDCYWQRTP